ncbi:MULTISPECIES: cobalamin biosynthesis protein [unclassified Nodularia (in: cyanobacteria)]|uniref:cobalamin biosynthesis protein n=1 Tax=unclassified Nodularia (in: cyanobacteria) TaxID=2656917 RepID=UPI00187FC86F|nr:MULTISPECIES: cobalamin biosynthesis protein [unclassified Nodularia (in: cyanobacteria)]MBE9202015.1 cobalamin biosynthesis protein [Nodularia sp. LEGE 06071]MCC2694301.1 cobalamin biosynthesis protein [Nodularia sp. LEGE 04288]
MQQQNLWVGIGFKKGSSWQLIGTAIQQVFQENQLNENAIAGLATIDNKASEVGLIELCRLRNFSLKIFTADILSTVSVPNPGKIAEKTVGTPSVAEAAAILAASHITSSLTKNQEREIRLLVPKRIFRLQGEPGAVTIAVACLTKLFSKNS